MVPLTGLDGRCGGRGGVGGVGTRVVKGLGEEGGFLPFGQDTGELQLSKGKHAVDTSLVPPSKLRNFGKMDEGIEAYPFLTKLLPAKQERM